ncbi:MAG: TIM barrel protein [Acidobacteria bacterium]|nr:TIM barrel protein [Acidobacteriota bacterium]
MNRRHFVGLAGAAAAPAAIQTTPQQDYKPGRAVMHVGCQRGPTTPEFLDNLKRHGVDHCCGQWDYDKGFPTVDDLKRLRELGDKHGVSIDMIEMPLSSRYITRSASPSIMMGKSPERDRVIEKIQQLIRNCQLAGLPALKYNMTILGVLRTDSSTGRGGTTLSTWNLSKAKQDPALTEAGPAPAEVMWERITYFLDRVIPVANEHKIRTACHPHDPGVPKSGFRGVDRVLGTVEGMKKFASIQESPYHGFNFCQGTVAEMLQDPAKEIFDVIRYFGQRKKIFNVHFRNIRGKRDNFVETYPDEGDINFYRCMQVYKEVGYPYMMMPDHMPRHKDDPGAHQAFAFAYGYIKALIQAVS